MRKTRASQASSSEKLMRLKQELATTAELVNGVLKREQLKREASQQAKAVWEKREDFANLKRKFPSLLNAKEDEELLYDKERVVKRVKPTEQVYAYFCSLRVYKLDTDVVVVLGVSSSRRATTMVILCLRYRTMTPLCVPRSALRRSWHKSIGRWPGSKSAIIIGKTEWR
jgi:hypothetical protein